MNAANAEYVYIELASDGITTMATYSMIWNISKNTTFQCYGTGCFNLGDIYRGNDTDLTFLIDSCAQCTSIKGCLNEFNLICDSGSDTFTPEDGCDNSNECGCSDIITNTDYDASYSDKSCYSILTVQTCLPDRPCVLYCDSISCQLNVLDGRGSTSLTVLCITAVRIHCFCVYMF